MSDAKGDRKLPEHVAENRRYWDGMADEWVASGERGWETDAPSWGCWHNPETELKLMPDDMSGMRAIELGCGTGYVSCWLARRGAEVVAIDNSERQLATAKRLSAEHAIPVTFHHGNAETVPYPDQHFDFAISEYGAAIWCDPKVWIPEARRILKPGGELVFLGNSPLSMICTPADGGDNDARLHRSYFDLGRLDWTKSAEDPGGMEFNMPISSWMQLFREVGFEVLDYMELQAPKGSPDQYGTPGSWAESWPAEQVWKLRRSDL
jgi:SAM-dependent methyltransferase